MGLDLNSKDIAAAKESKQGNFFAFCFLLFRYFSPMLGPRVPPQAGLLEELAALEAASPAEAAGSPNDRGGGGSSSRARIFTERPGLPALLGVGITIGTNVETRVEITSNAGRSWTVILPPAPASFIGARGLVTGFPDREPMFDTSLMRGLNQLNMHEIGEELNDQDTRLLASVLGTANTEDATIACSDGDIFSKLLGAIVDAEPEGAGSAIRCPRPGGQDWHSRRPGLPPAPRVTHIGGGDSTGH